MATNPFDDPNLGRDNPFDDPNLGKNNPFNDPNLGSQTATKGLHSTTKAAPVSQKAPEEKSWLGGITDDVSKWAKDYTDQIKTTYNALTDPNASNAVKAGAVLERLQAPFKQQANLIASVPASVVAGLEGAAKGAMSGSATAGMKAMNDRMQQFTPYPESDPTMQLGNLPMTVMGKGLEGTGRGYGEIAKAATGDTEFGNDISNAVQLALAGGMSLEGGAKGIKGVLDARKAAKQVTVAPIEQPVAEQPTTAPVPYTARTEAPVEGPNLFEQPPEVLQPENPPVPVQQSMEQLTQEAPLPELQPFQSTDRVPDGQPWLGPKEEVVPALNQYGPSSVEAWDADRTAPQYPMNQSSWRDVQQNPVDTPPTEPQFKFKEPTALQQQVDNAAENRPIQWPSDIAADANPAELPKLLDQQLINDNPIAVQPKDMVATVTPFEESKGFIKGFGYARDNISDVYTDVQKTIGQAPDLDSKMIARRNVLTQGGAMRRVLQDNPAYQWGSSLIEGASRKAKLAAENAEHAVATSFNKMRWLDGVKSAREGIMHYIRGTDNGSPHLAAYKEAIKGEMEKLYQISIMPINSIKWILVYWNQKNSLGWIMEITLATSGVESMNHL